MKVNKILQIIPDLELAGAETMCENLVCELNKKKEIAIISFFTKNTAITERIEKKGIKIYYLDKKKGIDFSIIFKIKKIINDFKPDIIHTHRYCLEYAYPAIKISKYKKTKIVHTVHNVATKEVTKIRRCFRKMFLLKGNVLYVAISNIIQDTICNEYNLHRNNVPIVFNGINMENCIIKRKYDPNNIILNIGRFSEQKNQLFLLEIFSDVLKKYPNYTLKIIGNGPLENELILKAEELNISKNVSIEKNKSSCYEDLNYADLYVMTSKWEGFPMTLIEAMGTGLPIISSNVGGIPDMLDNEKEAVLLELNKNKFVNEIIDMIKYKEKREKLGRNALNKSKRFSSEIMAEQYIKIYEKNYKKV